MEATFVMSSDEPMYVDWGNGTRSYPTTDWQTGKQWWSNPLTDGWGTPVDPIPTPTTITWPPITWNTDSQPNNKQNEEEIEGYIMKKLFNIYVIYDQGGFLMNRAIVADDEEDAKFEANVSDVIRKANLKYKDVTVVTQLISGGIKIKKEEQAQLVKVVE